MLLRKRSRYKSSSLETGAEYSDPNLENSQSLEVETVADTCLRVVKKFPTVVDFNDALDTVKQPNIEPRLFSVLQLLKRLVVDRAASLWRRHVNAG